MTETASDTRRGAPATLQLERDEGAALVSACLVILLDLLKGAQTFPPQARPLFRVYCKLCALSNHQADIAILKAGMATWEEKPG